MGESAQSARRYARAQARLAGRLSEWSSRPPRAVANNSDENSTRRDTASLLALGVLGRDRGQATDDDR